MKSFAVHYKDEVFYGCSTHISSKIFVSSVILEYVESLISLKIFANASIL